MHDDDEKFDDFLREAARDYNAPVTPRADALWAAIQPEVARAIAPKRRTIRPLYLIVGSAIAATLVLGVAVGRWSSLRTGTPPVAVREASPDSVSRGGHARAVTMEHFAEAEVFLTSVRSELKAGLPDAERAERSRDLLVRTRVLLGASQQRSPEIARLLEDLELLLAEIAAMPASNSPLDQRLLDESMRDGNVIPRIRATLPDRASGA